MKMEECRKHLEGQELPLDAIEKQLSIVGLFMRFLKDANPAPNHGGSRRLP